MQNLARFQSTLKFGD